MTATTTLQDVARDVNLSVSAVWKALADDPVIPTQTRRRVLEASRRLDYQPKRYNRKRKATAAAGLQRLGLVLVGSDRGMQSMTDSLMAISRELNLSVKVQMLLISTDEPDIMSQTLSEAAEENDGLILSGFVTPAVLRLVNTLRTPYVVMGNTHELPDHSTVPAYSVGFDVQAMAHRATRWLIERGHRRIGFMAMETPLNLWYDRWLAGYRYAHFDAGLPVDESLVVITGKTRTPDEVTADAWLGQTRPPTACVIPDPSLAVRVTTALEKRGQPMPADCVVIGSTRAQADDYGASHFPCMTVDSQLLTRTCLSLIRAQSAGQAVSPYRIVLPHTFENLPDIK